MMFPWFLFRRQPKRQQHRIEVPRAGPGEIVVLISDRPLRRAEMLRLRDAWDAAMESDRRRVLVLDYPLKVAAIVARGAGATAIGSKA